MADLRKRCRCRSLEPLHTRRAETNSSTRPALGTSVPKSGMRAGRRTSCTFSTSRRYEAKKITDSVRANRDPMWIGDKIFFNSDRDGHFNLYAYDTKSAKTTQITTNKDWDVRWPSTDKRDRIVFELNGELQILNVKNGKATPISVNVPDDGVNRRPSRVSASALVESAGLSPKGERVVFAARGDIFSAPVENGPTRNLTKTSGAHDKWPKWSPDGSKIAFISDKSGEEEVWLVVQDGSTPPEQLTSGGKGMRYEPEWSADGKRIAVQRQGREAVRRNGCRQEHHGSRSIARRRHSRLRVVPDGELSGVQHG